jgi:hypothetical protein
VCEGKYFYFEEALQIVQMDPISLVETYPSEGRIVVLQLYRGVLAL